jgi:hypothetical protein
MFNRHASSQRKLGASVLQRLVAPADARQQIKAIDLIAPVTGLWRKRKSGKTNLLDVVAASGLEMCLSQ